MTRPWSVGNEFPAKATFRVGEDDRWEALDLIGFLEVIVLGDRCIGLMGLVAGIVQFQQDKVFRSGGLEVVVLEDLEQSATPLAELASA